MLRSTNVYDPANWFCALLMGILQITILCLTH